MESRGVVLALRWLVKDRLFHLRAKVGMNPPLDGFCVAHDGVGARVLNKT